MSRKNFDTVDPIAMLSRMNSSCVWNTRFFRMIFSGSIACSAKKLTPMKKMWDTIASSGLLPSMLSIACTPFLVKIEKNGRTEICLSAHLNYRFICEVHTLACGSLHVANQACTSSVQDRQFSSEDRFQLFLQLSLHARYQLIQPIPHSVPIQ